MKVFEASLEITVDQYSNAADLIFLLGRAVADQIAAGEQVVRFIVTSQSANRFFCELGILSMPSGEAKLPLFNFRRREYKDERDFNAVFLVPTGIGA